VISKKAAFAVLIVISLIAIGVLSFHRRAPVSVPSLSAESTSQMLAAPMANARTTTASRHNAAAAVRAQTIAETKPPQSAQPRQHPVSNTQASEPKNGVPSSTAKPRKSAKEVIDSFTSDDPKQVFLPETVRYHAAVQAEAIDPDWAPQTESALTSFIGSQLGNGIELLEADCRTDLCEISLVQANEGESDAKFSDVMKRLRQQPWWDSLQLDQETQISTWDDGRFVTIHYFSRK
jgi:hypothetical protein